MAGLAALEAELVVDAHLACLLVEAANADGRVFLRWWRLRRLLVDGAETWARMRVVVAVRRRVVEGWARVAVGGALLVGWEARAAVVACKKGLVLGGDAMRLEECCGSFFGDVGLDERVSDGLHVDVGEVTVGGRVV